MTPPELRLRILFGTGAMLGPGKAELLAGIAASGSIAAAGRAMGMSYKRAWMLVDEMNRSFRLPLVESTRGGASGGAARLTETGAEVLAQYRALQAALAKVAEEPLQTLQALLAVPPPKD